MATQDPLMNPRTHAAADPILPLENSYARLPEHFYARVEPRPVAAPRLIRVNRELASGLGLDAEALASPDGVQLLAGNRVAAGSAPLALAYAGYQFGNFVPQLGDGRATLLGEVVDAEGVRRDIQLKGSGRTPFSRMGDGRAALGPVMREYIVSEAMAAFGIPTTRALAMVATGEPVYRQRPEPGAVLTRVAASHLRVGTFEYFHARGDTAAVRVLADYAIERHYPHLRDAERPYQALIEAVAARTAELVAQWLQVGFIHGVMNTDNTAIAGETLDYGPCAFMDTYDPGTVYSSIDLGGRYAYDQQPHIGHWNLARFAETLLPLLADDQETAVERAYEALAVYPPRFRNASDAGLCRKIGLTERREGDVELARELLNCMAEQEADFTLTFRRLGPIAGEAADAAAGARELFNDPAAFDAWAARWRERLDTEPGPPAEKRALLESVNPAFIPRNHRIEQAIRAATEENNFAPMERLLTVLATPYAEHPEHAEYAQPPGPGEAVRQTFCGT